MKFFFILEDVGKGQVSLQVSSMSTPEEMAALDPKNPPEITKLAKYLTKAFEEYQLYGDSTAKAIQPWADPKKLN